MMKTGKSLKALRAEKLNPSPQSDTPSNRTTGATESEGYPGIAHDFETMRLECNRLREINAELLAALEAIAEALDVPRDRLRRLDGEHGSAESLRLLAVKYKTPGAQDRMDQSVHVARAAIQKATKGE